MNVRIKTSALALVLVMSMMTATVYAQFAKQINHGWWTGASAGLGVGASDIKPLLQAEGGLRLQRHLVGVGVGYDWYIEPAVPLFAAYRLVLDNRRLFMLYADGGYALIADRSRPLTNPSHIEASSRGGFTGEIGLRTRIPMKRDGLVLSIGYNRRESKQTDRYSYSCLVPPCDVFTEKYTYDYNRIVARLGWQFMR